MHLAIYRINQPMVDSLIELTKVVKLKKQPCYFNFLIRPKAWKMGNRLKKFCDQNSNSHIYTHNHSKVLAVKRQVDIMSLRGAETEDNARIGSTYTRSPRRFRPRKEWMNELVNG